MTVYNAESWYKAIERGEVRAGDLVTGDVVMDAMNALPPVCMRTSCAQLGEPYSHVFDDVERRRRPVFWTWRLVERNGNAWDESSTWEFCGACFAGEKFNREANYEPTRSEAIA